jgi:hypothetical protein
MGCYGCLKNKSSYELLIDEIFSYLPIRKIKIEVVLERLEQHVNFTDYYFITETSFQMLLNSFLVPDLVEYETILFAYWTDVYRRKPYKQQYPLMKLLFAMLSNFDCRKDIEYFNRILVDYKTSTKEDDPLLGKNRVTVEHLFTVVRDYIYSISYLTIDYLKNFHPDPTGFKVYLKKLWDQEVIDAFVKNTFFSKHDTWNTKIYILVFLDEHLKLLKDDVELRKRLSKFSVQYSKSLKEIGENLCASVDFKINLHVKEE